MEPEVDLKGVELRRKEVNPSIQSKIQDKKKPIFHLRTKVEEDDEGGVVFITNHTSIKREEYSTAGLWGAAGGGMFCVRQTQVHHMSWRLVMKMTDAHPHGLRPHWGISRRHHWLVL